MPAHTKKESAIFAIATAKTAPSDSHVQSFARGLSVIRSFSSTAKAQTMTQVAASTGLTRAGARRILHTLLGLGYVAFDGKLFVLTPRILDLGFAYLSTMPLWNLAEPAMETLTETTAESCSAAVLDGQDIVYVLRVPTRKVMRISLSVGSRLPAHCTSMGRMLLADLSDSEIEAHLATSHLVQHTAKTSIDPIDILKKVVRARAQGWCLVDQELEEGLVSIAAPIRDHTGRAIAALNVSGQANRTSARTMQERMLSPLLVAAERISRTLGAGAVI